MLRIISTFPIALLLLTQISVSLNELLVYFHILLDGKKAVDTFVSFQFVGYLVFVDCCSYTFFEAS